MKDLIKGVTVFFFYTSLLLYPDTGHTRVSPQRIEQLKVKYAPFNEKEISYLANYSSYLKFSIYIQGLEIKKKLACLGFEDLATFYTLNSNYQNSFEKEKISDAFKNLKKSEECEVLLKETLPDIIYSFYKMRVELSLHQASDYEILSKFNFGTHQIPGSVDFCEHLKSPIVYKGPNDFTSINLCVEDVKTIANLKPKHLIKKSNLFLLDSVVSSVDLPEISDLDALTFPEFEMATDTFKDQYTLRGGITDFDITREKTPNFKSIYERDRFYADNPVARNLDRYGIDFARYMAARNYQNPAGGDLPEESAPYKYSQSIAKYPFLAFFKPVMKEIDLNCSLYQKERADLCERYKNSFKDNKYYTFDSSKHKETLARALTVSLKLNHSMIESLNSEFPISDLTDSNGVLLKSAPYNSLSSWSKLMKMKNLSAHFFSLYNELEGQQHRFVKELDSRKTFKLIASLTTAVGLGLSCGLIGNFWGLAACIGASGIGVNTAFYADAYWSYERDFGMFFATDIAMDNGGELLTLIEFGTLESSLQNLYIEKIFLGIGTGAGEILKRAKHLRSLKK